MNEPAVQPVKVQFVQIDADQAGQRIDNFLVSFLKGVPKSRIYRILRKGEVRVNKGRVQPEHKLQAGDLIRIPPLRMAQDTPPPRPGSGLIRLLETAVLYESEGLLVINKPFGLAVHGGSGVSLGLIEALRQMRPQARYLELVHRLDRDTSGCIMIAKKRSVLRFLQTQLREKGINKVYMALVAGRWPNHCRQVEAPLKKNELSNGERIVRVDSNGKPALTLFRVLNRYETCTLVEAKPVTGRTHQIRVHAQYAGHGLIGDEKYGDDEQNKSMRKLGFKRLFLHAAQLSFCLPGEDKPTLVDAPLSEDLVQALSNLEKIGTTDEQGLKETEG